MLSVLALGASVPVHTFANSYTFAQEKLAVNGIVTNEEGKPLVGVSIKIKGQSLKGTTTDLNGRYVLEINKGETVVFTMVSYQTVEIANVVDAKLDVSMELASSQIDDVVVVAFGTQKKKEVIGAMTSVNPSDLKVPSSNLTTALAGRVAGMIAYQRSGEPGADNADFFIRGVTTFGYKKDPLILIDGVEFTSTELARLQVDDIASFSIMKDAAATSLYGARGANGVILVTTKQGKEGPAKVSLRVENSISMPTQEVQLADPITYMRMQNESILTRNPLGAALYSQNKIDNTAAGNDPLVYPANNWKDMLLKDMTMNQRYNMSVSGGGQVAQYYFAGTFNQDNGILNVDNRNNFNNNIDLKTYLLRSNVNVNITKTTQAGVRFYGSFDEYTGPLDGGTAMYNKIMRSNPVMFPAYYPKTDKYDYIQHIMFGGTQDRDGLINPYADMVKGYKDSSKSLMMAQFELKHNFSYLTEGLNFRVMANTTRNSFFSTSRFYNPFYYVIADYDQYTKDYNLTNINPNGGREELSFSEGEKKVSSTFYMESALNYNRSFNKHSISGLLVFLMQQNLTGNAGSLQLSLPSRNLGISGRGTYSFDERYFAEFNFGYNGSERFDKSHRFGFFPSAGVAWQLSNEKFWDNLKASIPSLKLRATYGLVGNDAIGSERDRFFYLSDINLNSGATGGLFGMDLNYTINGITINRYANPDITWEIARKTNLGFEMNLFKKVDIQADFFKEHRTNILMPRSYVPAFLGLATTTMANVGEASSKGFEFSIDYKENIGEHMWMSARANFTYATSQFEVYEEPNYVNAPWKSRVGNSINQTYGYIAERLFVDDEEVANSPTQQFGSVLTQGGDIKYRDVNNDGVITELDMVPIGNPTSPEIVYGFGFSIGYKKFDCSAFFQGLAQESFWFDTSVPTDVNINTIPFINDQQLLQAYADSYWNEQTRDIYAMYPRLSNAYHQGNMQKSTWFMRDGSFLRLKNVEMGYTFTKGLVKKIGLSNLRLYGSGTNLLTWSAFKTWDVEMAGNGLGYPVQRVYNMGIQVSF